VSARAHVATWNVHGCVGRDGRRDAGRVAEVIAALDAELVALQEVDTRRAPGLLDEIAARTGMLAVAGPTMGNEEGFFGNALLTRRAHLRVARHDISLPGAEPRGVLEVELELRGRPARVLVTHFGLTRRERTRQTDLVLRAVEDAEDRAQAVILMGDFNEWRPRARTFERVDRALGRAPRARSFPARLPLFALDRVWVRPRAALVGLRAWRAAPARTASDHLPVVAELDLRRLEGAG
jgi:endonuclease/exonuclease/phosphatase family metal-dependent hydrolase